jgi:hypothetical protein
MGKSEALMVGGGGVVDRGEDSVSLRLLDSEIKIEINGYISNGLCWNFEETTCRKGYHLSSKRLSSDPQ